MNPKSPTQLLPANTPQLVPKKGAPAERRGLFSAPQVETYITGGILAAKDKNAALAIAERYLSPPSFTDERHRLVFRAMQALRAAGLAINHMTVLTWLDQNALLDRISIADLTDGMPELVDIESFCKIVAEAEHKRRLFATTEAIQTRLEIGDSIADIVSDLRTTLDHTSANLPTTGLDFEAIQSVREFNNVGIEWAVEGILARGCLHGFTGAYGSGKTSLISAMAAKLARGERFLNRECAQLPVIHFHRENPVSSIVDLLNRLGIQDGTNYKIVGPWCCPSGVPGPDHPDVIEYARKHKPFMIWDSHVAFMDGADENDASAVRPVMQRYRYLTDLGATVAVLHHSSDKSENAQYYRGSTDFPAALDIAIHVTNFGEGRLDRMRLKPFKSRFETDADMIIHYRDGEFVADERPNAVSRTVTEQLRDLLRQHPRIKSKEFEDLAASKKLGRDRAREYLANGIAGKSIQVIQGPRNAKFHQLAEDANS